jgi:hypothetical protein
VSAAVLALLTGCSSADDWSRPHASPTPVGTLRPGFADPSRTPVPESTLTPRPGSWDEVSPPDGYRVVLLTTGEQDASARRPAQAVRAWADKEDVSLRTVTADDPAGYVDAVLEAIELGPDLVISAGEALVDPLAALTPSHLEQQFLVLGAQLPEPTENVTAAGWSGASFRGEELGMSFDRDPASFTDARCAAAVRAGVAAVLSGLTGIVLWLDDVS